MIKDIPQHKVEGIAIAAVPQKNPETGENEWYVFLINMKAQSIHNVLIASRGYGTINDEEIKTSELRHHVEELPANSYVKVELIMDELFKLNNQYWVSFYHEGVLFDKKYIFLQETILESNMTEIPLMGEKGILLS